jgi:hypothetical protein
VSYPIPAWSHSASRLSLLQLSRSPQRGTYASELEQIDSELEVELSR